MKYLVFFTVFFVSTCRLQAQTQPIDKEGLVLSGYDLLSYFSNRPEEGSPKYTVIFKGRKYRFVSESHKGLFLRNPEKYLPQYDGWCAYAMATSGEKVSVNPESFTIYKGRLYMFYKTFFNDTLSKWKEEEDSMKSRADKNWGKLQ